MIRKIYTLGKFKPYKIYDKSKRLKRRMQFVGGATKTFVFLLVEMISTKFEKDC